ncbi:unnamed protein product, partial [marine sediment metagenome]
MVVANVTGREVVNSVATHGGTDWKFPRLKRESKSATAVEVTDANEQGNQGKGEFC